MTTNGKTDSKANGNGNSNTQLVQAKLSEEDYQTFSVLAIYETKGVVGTLASKVLAEYVANNPIQVIRSKGAPETVKA